MRSFTKSVLQFFKIATPAAPENGKHNDATNMVVDRIDTANEVYLPFNPQRSSINRFKITYVFVITIIRPDALMTTDLNPGKTKAGSRTVLALYNASCERNYISGRFAAYARENHLVDKERKGIVALVWTCPGLGHSGRYKQRTIFWVAQDAAFDVLFCPENNNNVSINHAGQFDKGIEAGHLMKEISFEAGVHRGFLLPVYTSTETNSSCSSTLMPTLSQIRAQLDNNIEKESEYEMQSELNVGRVTQMHIGSFDTTETSNERNSLLASSPLSDNDASWYPAHWPPNIPSKRSFSLRSEQVSRKDEEECERLPKVRKSRNGSISASSTRSLDGKPMSENHRSESPAKYTHRRSELRLSHIDDICHLESHQEAQTPSNPTEDIDSSLTLAVDVDIRHSTFVYPSPTTSTHFQEPGSELGERLSPVKDRYCIDQRHSQLLNLITINSFDPQSANTRQLGEKRTKSKISRHRNRLSRNSLHVPSPTFDDYWTLDTGSGGYYHQDIQTGKRSWYRPPRP